MASIKPQPKDTIQQSIKDFISPPVKVYSPKQKLAAEQALCYKLNDWCMNKGLFCYEGNQHLAANGRPALLVIKPLGNYHCVAVWAKAPGCVTQSSVKQEASIRKYEHMFITCVVDDFEQAKRDIDFYLTNYK